MTKRPPDRKHWILVSLLGLVALSLALWSSAAAHWAKNSAQAALSNYRVRSIQVLGTKRLSAAEILAISGVKEGTPLFEINLKTVADRLRAHPWIREATPVRRLPSTLELHIREEEPAALLNAGRLWAVAADGVVLPLEKFQWRWDLPLLRVGNLPALKSGITIREKLTCALLAQCVACQHCAPRVWTQLSELFWRDNEIWAILQNKNVELRLGKGTDEIGWKALERLLMKLNGQQRLSNVELIDLRFPGRIVVRYTQDSLSFRNYG
jgi:cell division septal protein FtsQ